MPTKPQAIQKMNTKEEIETVKLEEQETTGKHIGIITFNQWLYEKKTSKELSLRDPKNFMKTLDDFLIRKAI